MKTKRTGSGLVVLGLLLATGQVLADGSGMMGDEAQSFEYREPGPYVVPNITPMTSGITPVVCEPGTPTCAIFRLSVAFTEEFREKNPDAYVDVLLGWKPGVFGPGQVLPDFDLYLYDEQGREVDDAATSANPEVLSLPLETLANGTYEFHVIPFAAMGEGFTLTGGMSGLSTEGKSGVFGGALGAGLLFSMALLGLRRRLRR